MESFQSKLAKLLLRIIKLNKMWKLTGDRVRKKYRKKTIIRKS